MEDNINANFNYAECIKSKTDFFSSTYFNICNGTQEVVPHGSLDIMFIGLAGAVILALFLLIGAALVAVYQA